MESPFVTTSRIINEQSCASDDIRIIAHDGKNLEPAQRDILKTAADDFEAMQRNLITIYAQLIETQQKFIAVNEQLIEARKAALPKAAPMFSMSSGG